MILITGATGNIGRNVLSELVGTGTAVRALSRDPGRLHDLPNGVQTVRADLSHPSTLPAALEGVDAVFLYAVPGSAPAFLDAAAERGVQRVVFLSSSAVRDDVEQQTNAIAAFHADIEHAIEKSGLDWTFLRPSALAANALQWAQQIRTGDVVYGPYAGAHAAPVHEKDVAAVAARALTTPDYVHSTLALTGPQSLTQAEQVSIIGDVVGGELHFQEVPPESAREQMIQFLPEPVADALLASWAATVGGPAAVEPTVERITGRPPRSFRDWVADHAGAFTAA